MRKLTILFSSVFLTLAVLCGPGLAAQSKGIKVVIKDGSGQQVALYKGSYALLIGVSDYTAGWPSLNSVPGELDRVEATLKDRGFHVVKVMDPPGASLKRAFENFIGMYGFQQDNRLLFFFSGHGHTREKRAKGYLVPADAPNPNKDRVGFLRKALPMNQILAWSRQIEAKHALFLFDSCFSGTVFKAKDLPEKPPHITRATALSVRQYITAGDAGESVPAKSVFTPAFIDALEYGWGDLNKDGYVSGTELGLYLQEKVPQHSRQNPQYGKIRDYDLARGDFIFQLASMPSPVVPESSGIQNYANIIEEREANRKQWGLWQSRMKDDFAKVQRYDKSSALNDKEKAEAWEGILASYSIDNPYTVEDNIFRMKALERNRHWKEYKESGKLFVDTVPSNARVRILNIGPKFFQGMELDPGSYHVETSKQGYETQKKWVSLKAGENKRLDVRLEQLQASIQPKPSYSQPSSTSNLEKERRELEQLRAELEKKQRESQNQRIEVASVPQKPSSSRPSSSTSNVTNRDGVYVAHANGIMKDTKTDLEWKVGPDSDTNWNDARSWVQSLNLDGGGWRMPTMDELEDLYKKGKGGRNMTPLLKTTGWWVWSGETKGSSEARSFYFYGGNRRWYTRGNSYHHRAFAVRSRGVSKSQKVEVASLQQNSLQVRPSSTSNVIKRDGIYVAYANGIVKDTNTGLEWKAGPDSDTDWNDARSWVQSLNLDGGGWRMPTLNELEGLYKTGKGDRNMTPLLKTTGWRVWSSEPIGSSDAGPFAFYDGSRIWGSRANYRARGFAVRSRGDG